MITKTADKHLNDLAIIMAPGLDQVAIAKENIEAGTRVDAQGGGFEIKDYVRKGHRFAIQDISSGEYLKQYGYPFARSKGIQKGQTVTTENIENVVPDVSPKDFSAPAATPLKKEYKDKKFSGFARKD